MKLVGAGQQGIHHYIYDVSSTVTVGGTAQLVMAQATSRSFLYLQNNSLGPLWLEFGSARARCTISAGAVNAVTIGNAGFNFTNPPVVRFFGGGGFAGTGSTPAVGAPFLGGNLPGYNSPSNPARGHAVMTGAAPNLSVASIAIDNPGSGYLCAPYVFIFNSDLDPYGCALPASNVGIQLTSGQPLMFNGTCCPTDAISIWGASTGQAFTAKFMD